MINYDTHNKFQDLYQLKKSDTFRRLIPSIVIVCFYTAAIVYIEIYHFSFSETSPLKQFTTFHTLFGFVISMLLVFRTNTAYDRWWEGRKLWGSLTNNSRNLAIKMNGYLPEDDIMNRKFFKKIIPLFATELKKHLQAETTRLALDTEPHPEIPDFDHTRHMPAQIASVLTAKMDRLYKQKIITGEQYININAEVTSFMDVCGACERIKNTPIPYSYRTFIKKFIFLYILTLPIGLAFVLHYVLIPVVALAFYVLASLELIAEEIEDPFGNDDNDLPMDKIAANIRKNVEDILHV